MQTVHVHAAASRPIDIDRLVAVYSARGRTHRRSERRRGWLRRALAVAAVAASGALVWLGGVSRDWLTEPARDDGVGELRSIVSAELEDLRAARAELAAERERYDAKSTELERQLAAFAERHAAIEARQADLTAQSAELSAAIADAEAQRAALLAAEVRGREFQTELEAIGAERTALEERRQAFTDQGRELSGELEALQRQRDELEAERASMERERRELEGLLETAGAGVIPDTSSLPTMAPAEPALSPLLASAVSPGALGGLRGGLSFGNGMNVAIGLTRTAAVNGVEQYSSVLRLDDLTAGIAAQAFDALRPVVIQNGTGNYLSPTALDNLSSGLGTVVQNTLDGQEISTATIYDVSIEDVSNAVRNMAADQAISESLIFHR